MTATPQESETIACPACGRTITVDRRFRRWCEYCEWNLRDPADALDANRRPRRADAARARGDALFAQVKQDGVGPPRRDANRIASFVLALAVHAVTLAVLVAGVAAIWSSFPNVFAFAVGIPLLILAFLLRPRFGTIKAGTVLMPRDHAPALYRLVDRIAVAMDAKPVDVIATDARFNASYAHVGLRRRRVMWIGLSLWNVLDDQERIALLGHELAHEVNGDVSHGLVVGSALRTLAEWHAALDSPRLQRGTRSVFSGIDAIAQALAALFMRGVRRCVEAIYDFERSLIYQSQQRAEYYADALSARVGSTDAALGTLDSLYLADQCALAVRYSARRDDPDVWAAERQFFATISPKEWERQRRIDAHDATAIDSTHPPTNLRIQLLKSRPSQRAAVTIETAEAAAIAQELQSAYDLVEDGLKTRLSQ